MIIKKTHYVMFYLLPTCLPPFLTTSLPYIIKSAYHYKFLRSI